MTGIPLGETLQLFGLFELDDAGTVLYSRPDNDELSDPDHSMVGHNFFEKIGPLENADFLRQHFKNFLGSQRSVDNFTFESSYKNAPLKARILMTRGHETHHDPPAGIVIMDIKKNTL